LVVAEQSARLEAQEAQGVGADALLVRCQQRPVQGQILGGPPQAGVEQPPAAGIPVAHAFFTVWVHGELVGELGETAINSR